MQKACLGYNLRSVCDNNRIKTFKNGINFWTKQPIFYVKYLKLGGGGNFFQYCLFLIFCRLYLCLRLIVESDDCLKKTQTARVAQTLCNCQPRSVYSQDAILVATFLVLLLIDFDNLFYVSCKPAAYIGHGCLVASNGCKNNLSKLPNIFSAVTSCQLWI
jgi:hypothetical protein